MRSSLFLYGAALLLAGVLAASWAGPARPAPQALGVEYAQHVRPLLREYCLGCHSTNKHAGELDLERFATLADARGNGKAWNRVPEMLTSGQMPPKGARQPTAAQRAELTGWTRRFLQAEALAHAGDPGPVVLRRLNNAEYTYTVRDLTGVPELDPAHEFPADSAAGEGFTNTGAALVMSPALLTKYFDAGKEIARHAELLPDGFRFSPHTTRSDWTNDTLAQIRALYRRYTDAGGASTVNLQGVVFNTNEGGRLPVEKYLAATVEEREALQSGRKSVPTVAAARGLNGKYLGLLWTALNGRQPSPLLDPLRAEWRAAKPGDAVALAAAVGKWQAALWQFGSVGGIGKEGLPTAWQQPVTPLSSGGEVRLKLPAAPQGKEVTVYLATGDAGDGTTGDVAVWSRPRLVAPGRPDLPLRDVREIARALSARRERLFAGAARALEAAAAAQDAESGLDLAQLAQKHGVDPADLGAWLEYLGLRSGAPLQLAHMATKQPGHAPYPFITGWGSPDLPSLVTNSSGTHVRIPGNMKPHGVCVHPSPTLAACAGWQSPVAGMVQISGQVTHAHPECGDGVSWALELRRGSTRRRLASGLARDGAPIPFQVPTPVRVEKGDLLSLVIGPNGDHSCDLTDLELVVKSAADGREWSLTRDVADNVLAGNPHADRFGNAGIWHFYTEPAKESTPSPSAPAGSLLARWLEAENTSQRRELAGAVQRLLASGGADAKGADAALYRQLASLSGPLLLPAWRGLATAPRAAAGAGANVLGPDPVLFGKGPGGTPLEATSLCVQAPNVTAIHIPAELAAGAELVSGTGLQPERGAGGTVQMRALLARPGSLGLTPDAPVLVGENGAARGRLDAAFAEFRALFPVALAYTKIVPTDEVITFSLFHREDEPLQRLMLSAGEKAELDRLWSELHWVSQSPLKQVNTYEQIREFATQDRGDLAEPIKRLRGPVYEAAAQFEKRIRDAEPVQLDRLVQFAARAYRRPLTPAEAAQLRALYAKLRAQELPHEEAFRLTLARVFVAPAFLYRLEEAPAARAAAPVSDWELASRLSYFLWSSAPDEPLRAAAASGTLRRPEVLSAQLRRMLKDPKARRLATEFACQWLHVYEFDTLDEKSEKYFPEFAGLRGDMYEETIRFFTDLFQRDASVLSLFDADHTFVNERLARFYGIPGVTGSEWRRVDGMRARGRGGILGLASTLAKQSGASRTSPILRGAWVGEVLLGERLPRPPKDVPKLPEDETDTEGLTVRQLVTRHTSDPKCSGCHQKIDPYGYALEYFDAIGRFRATDLAHRPLDVKTRTPDGVPMEGLGGLREYLLRNRRETVLRQFCRKLLGYALGRAVQLSDEPLLADMQGSLTRNGYRFSVAVDKIVQSRQFREIRGGGTAQRAAGS